MGRTWGTEGWSLRARGALAAASLSLAGLSLAALAQGQPPPPPAPPDAPLPPDAAADAGAAPVPTETAPPAPTDVPPAPTIPPPVAPPPAPPPAPPGPYGYPPPGGAPSYGGWGPPVLPPQEPQKPPVPDGQTDKGVPFAQRGKIALDFAGYMAAEDSDELGASMNLVGTIPLADRTFIEAIVPFGWVVPLGNPTVGVHHVGKISKQLWITGGGALGIPLVGDDNEQRVVVVQMIPRSLWNMHHHYPEIFPLQARLGLEFHARFFALRAQLEPSLWVPIGNNEDVHGAFQHAVEAQFGHRIGGGLRLQGVIVGPRALFRVEDHYQFALSPFFVVHRDMGYLRLGLMLPMDEQLGPPFERSWGFLAAMGVNID